MLSYVLQVIKMKIIPPIVFLALTNGVGYFLYKYRYDILSNVNFVDHLDGLGSALASYATAMMALIFALIVILTSIDNQNTRTFKATGYLSGAYLFYLVCFIELGITLLFSFLCISNIKTMFVGSLAMVFAFITFLQVSIIIIQIIFLSYK